MMGFAIALLVFALAGCGDRPRPARGDLNDGVIVGPARLQQKLQANRQGAIVIEASWATAEKADDYLAGHIPGAIHVNTDVFENGYPRWHLRSPAELHKTIGELGIGPDATVVVYSKRPVAAARVWWILHYAGVRDVRYLNGGYEAWVRAGFPSETSVNSPSGVTFSAKVRELALASADYVKARGQDNSVLADVRSREEFEGRVSGYSYLLMKGRIPEAVYIENGDGSAGVYHDPATGLLRSVEEIRRLWVSRGLPIDGSSEIIFYCGSGWRSSLAYLYAKAMGLEKIRNYSDGWSGWSTIYTPDANEKGITPGWRQSPSANPRASGAD